MLGCGAGALRTRSCLQSREEPCIQMPAAQQKVSGHQSAACGASQTPDSSPPDTRPPLSAETSTKDTATLGAAFHYPLMCRRGQVGLREVDRQSHNSQLDAARVTLNRQLGGWGNCSPHEEKVQHLLGRTKSPVVCPGIRRGRGVTAQKGRHQVGHQSLRAACLDAPHHAGLIPVPDGHTFPLEWNT